MRFLRRERRAPVDRRDLEAARRERRGAEQRLAAAEREVTVPLRDLHKENHIGPLLSALIERRAGRRPGEPGPSPS